MPVLTLSLWTHCPSRREALYRAPAYLAGLKKDRWIAFEDLYKLEIKKIAGTAILEKVKRAGGGRALGK